jgi:hypothetical protein
MNGSDAEHRNHTWRDVSDSIAKQTSPGYWTGECSSSGVEKDADNPHKHVIGGDYYCGSFSAGHWAWQAKQ